MYNQSSSSHSMYNATNSTNTSQVVYIVDNKNQIHTQYPYLPEYSMDVSIFSYMYTLFLAFGCYTILNPVSARIFALKTIFNLAKYTITGYGLFRERVYRPYIKHVHPRLLKILNIDDGINEIVVVKNGTIIYSFKTMELFVKNNPIKFVKEFSDDSDDSDDSDEEEEGQGQGQASDPQSVPHPDPGRDYDLSDKVDYNKKCEQLTELIEAFKSHSLNDTHTSTPSTTETSETEETEETSRDNIPDDYILDPTAYDFIIRNFYYEDEKNDEVHSYVFKYDIFYKSEMVEKYDVAMIKDKYVSTKKFIGISLKTNGNKYNINLTSPCNYYVEDNSILNYSFLKWYMMKHYYVKLSRKYIISCIDNYVEMYRINSGKKILVHKNKFEVVDDETFDSDAHTDTDADTDADTGVGAHTDVDYVTDTENENENKNQTDNNKEPLLVVNTNLEESHEMCDIEILDYD